MPDVTAQLSYQIGGVNITSRISRTATGQIAHDPSVANGKLTPGKSGSLTTRTGNNAGVVTLSTGHGIATNDKVDVYWAGGVQYNCTATVATNAITIASGLGDNLPTQGTSVVMCKRTVITSAFSGDLIELLGVVANVAGHVQFLDAEDTSILPEKLTAGEAFSIIGGTNDANPLAGEAVAKIAVSINDTGTTGQLAVGVLYDSV